MGKVEADGAVVVTGNACNVQYWCGHGGCLFGYYMILNLKKYPDSNRVPWLANKT